MIRVKVCGVTRPADAELAVELGASAVGVVTWRGSPRAVSPGQAGEIARALPPFVPLVGVFVDALADEIRRWCEHVPLGAVQLHGEEDRALAASLPRPVIKAVRLTPDTVDLVAQAWPAEVTLLVDADDRQQRGGTGRVADWALAARLARQRRTILAGGLTAANVAEAARSVRPWAVDVASGVESSPGIKDVDRMRAFFGAVRVASAGPEAEDD